MEEKKVIYEDTRNKLYFHGWKRRQLERLGYTVERKALLVGDYSFKDDGRISVDTKADVVELANNLTNDHARFKRMLIRAERERTFVYILTEEELPEGGIINWQSPVYKRNFKNKKRGEKKCSTRTETLKKIMLTMQEKYPVMFIFCDPSESGVYIEKMLKGEFGK